MAIVLPYLCSLIVFLIILCLHQQNFENANAMLTMFVMLVILPQSAGEVPMVELILK